MGVSGGFSCARHGPPLMPGGDERALDRLLPPLTKIGSGGSGHYVKMIHNGIDGPLPRNGRRANRVRLRRLVQQRRIGTSSLISFLSTRTDSGPSETTSLLLSADRSVEKSTKMAMATFCMI